MSQPASSARSSTATTQQALARGPQTRLNHHTYEVIKERLLDGRYPSGQRISVDELRTEFGVSKQPVMEALRRLSVEGLVEIMPQVGCQVARYTADEVNDFFTVFSGMEAAIAEVAAARRTEAQLASLAEVGQRIRRLLDEPDRTTRAHDYRTLNREYHTIIHDMAHSRIMAEMSQRMWDLADFLITTTRPEPLHTVLGDRHADHERIRQALIDGDAAAARREMAAHLAGVVAPR